MRLENVMGYQLPLKLYRFHFSSNTSNEITSKISLPFASVANAVFGQYFRDGQHWLLNLKKCNKNSDIKSTENMLNYRNICENRATAMLKNLKNITIIEFYVY